ncbi:hypothetical protein RHMOL_Rhmol02G0292800 [Rhododendron molle]|uniref:Uncharacterized protein n=1 Tax=Rhododendron molle TaxID=49168 RepID=A0ACC0PVA3_RHOML|nr:hypothetical protein RHMOL_Rhmol02G0292800 [Rhododendron molle]
MLYRSSGWWLVNIVARCQILGLFNAASFDDTYMFLLVMRRSFCVSVSYQFRLTVLSFPDYCEKHAKPEDAGAAPEETSSYEGLTEDEYD